MSSGPNFPQVNVTLIFRGQHVRIATDDEGHVRVSSGVTMTPEETDLLIAELRRALKVAKEFRGKR